MEHNKLGITALRQHAIYLKVNRNEIDMEARISRPVAALVKCLSDNGYTLTEELLRALCAVEEDKLQEITDLIEDVMMVKLNWASLIRDWYFPTDEAFYDQLYLIYHNYFSGCEGLRTTFPCGHRIVNRLFHIDRYNGCPLCGKPFHTADFVYKGQGTYLKELRLFTEQDMRKELETMLLSTVPLDATQQESLKTLIGEYGLPDGITITMKETAMCVINSLIESDRGDEAVKLLKTPTDILRYLWYEKTGKLQIIEPRTYISKAIRNNVYQQDLVGGCLNAAYALKQLLKLKYSRSQCKMVARWINALPVSARQAAEDMHPKRGMWVRMIRALRLPEYSHRKGYEHLAEIMDVFYNQEYSSWAGLVEQAKRLYDVEMTLKLLKQRPGLFSRCLFATMLRLGARETMKAFEEITEQLPARLLLSLYNNAEIYFDKSQVRVVRTITGEAYTILYNQMLDNYPDERLLEMVNMVKDMYIRSMRRRFMAASHEGKTMYIAPELHFIPVSIGDRAATIQDTSCALMGTRFPVTGDCVRLFMQWGKGLPAQHLDMDLSCRVIMKNGREYDCSYRQLTIHGAQHSGDIQEIPDMVGTAEYIRLDIPALRHSVVTYKDNVRKIRYKEIFEAEYVIFTCNAYTRGAVSPNLVVGWMNADKKMKISKTLGVAYDPSCVQHMVRISETDLSKGLVFGVLDVQKSEIIWLEVPFTSQVIGDLDTNSVKALLSRLEKKVSIGELLKLKAEAQGMEIVDDASEADETYTYQWALNPANVSMILNS